ncbi:SDR family oxidoreductase [Nonomuraea sp. SYSU D8015]|uniref:SDR family oxidoreductase n=1 Tax=Nonomuraea sp. SYSU D8015 TaxID=2593644 RepID=UPI001CB6DD7C|nr:SDR family oxidoreductase [Nonomuraea sp. SYSU D8015]
MGPAGSELRWPGHSPPRVRECIWPTVAAQAGRIDICFNLISHGDVQGTPFIDMEVEDFVRPIDSITRSTFLTSQATARHMAEQGSRVILIFGGGGEPLRNYSLGGTLVAFEAQEAMRRQPAANSARRVSGRSPS